MIPGRGLSRREFLWSAGGASGAALAGGLPVGCSQPPKPADYFTPPGSPLPVQSVLSLPPPQTAGAVSLEQALSRRRSQRQFARDNLTIGQVGQILWATQGITSPQGFRTAPSAGATYPLDIYVLWSGRAARYDSSRHRLDIVYDQDRQPQVAETTIQPEIILAAPVVFIIVGVYERTAGRYGRERAGRYVCMEAGHAAQNLLLQASALGLGGVTIGAFDDERLSTAMELPLGHSPLYVIPIGRPA